MGEVVDVGGVGDDSAVDGEVGVLEEVDTFVVVIGELGVFEFEVAVVVSL